MHNTENMNIDGRITSQNINSLRTLSPTERIQYLKQQEAAYNFGPATFPNQVYIELTSQCNLKCIYCARASMTRPKMTMSEKLARKAIEECAENKVYYITFHHYGEPTLEPEFHAEMFNYAKKCGIPKVATTSNMVLMNENIATMWIKSGLDSLHCSYEGANSNIFKQVRGVESGAIFRKILLFRECRDRLQSKTPFLGVSCIRTMETDEECEVFRAKMEQIVDDVSIRGLALVNNKANISQQLKNNTSEFYYTRESVQRIPCRQLGIRLLIASNGEVSPCSWDMDMKLSLGNIEKSTLREMWHSDKFARLFMQHRQQRWDDIPECCKSCTDWDFNGAVVDWDAVNQKA